MILSISNHLFDIMLSDQEIMDIIENMFVWIKDANINIQYRWAVQCYKASLNYGNMLAEKLNLDKNRLQ